MATLVVLAHPEPQSFNAAWARASAASAPPPVALSDLYAMGFDPAEGPAHHPTAARPFDALKAQEGPLPPDVAGEVAKIRAADLIVFHFPIWWFGPPAMLKGWIDRVLAHGHLHDTDTRFDTGLCRGKRALFCVTTGSSAAESGPGGKEGDARLLLWPLAYALRYLGFDVYAPVLLHGVHGYHRGARRDRLSAALRQALADQPRLIATLSERPLIRFNADAEFEGGRLRPDAPVLSPFIDPR